MNMFCRYMVCISAICGGYAFVAAVSLWIRFLVNKVWLFFVSDQVCVFFLQKGMNIMNISDVLF